MDSEDLDLMTACTDLVSLKKLESFLVHLLTHELGGEWVGVKELCERIGLTVAGLTDDVFATWLADPTENDDYVVIIFYDDESKWTMAAQYNRQRLMGGAVPVPWDEALGRIQDSQQDPACMPSAVLAAISYVEDLLAKGDPPNSAIPFADIEKRFEKEMEHLQPEKKGKAFQPVYWLFPNVEVWDLYRGADGPVVLYEPEFRPWQRWMYENDIHVRFKPKLLNFLLAPEKRARVKAKLELLRDAGTEIATH